MRKAPLLSPGGQRRRGVVPTVYDPAVQNAAAEVWSALGGVSIAGASVLLLAKLIREANYDPNCSYYSAMPSAIVAEETSLIANPATEAALPSTNTDDDPKLINIAKTSTVLISEPSTAAQQNLITPTEAVVPAPTAAQAAAVLDELTANAPVAATPVSRVMGSNESDNESAPASIVEKVSVDISSSAGTPNNGKEFPDTSLAAEPASSRVATAVFENKIENALEEYEARLNKILKQSAESAQQKRRMQLQSKATQVAAPSQGYQVKIDSLWQTYEQKKKQEEARLQRSEKILLDLAAVEKANNDDGNLRSPFVEMWQRVLSVFAAVRAWFAHLISQFSGGKNGNGAGASA